MSALVSVLDTTLAGRSQMVMLAGEPGMGKTSTARELTNEAEQRGAQVLWGWCHEQTGTPPYWPWLQLVLISEKIFFI